MADASEKAVGAVLYNKVAGKLVTICCASATLTDAEAKYIQFEREGLAAVFVLKKYHKYVCGRRFTIKTDSIPVKMIFHPEKFLILRLQDFKDGLCFCHLMTMILFFLLKKSGSSRLMSRLPLPKETGHDSCAQYVSNINDQPKSKIDAATSDDTLLQKVSYYIINGLPNKLPIELDIP